MENQLNRRVNAPRQRRAIAATAKKDDAVSRSAAHNS
jgi:hypothetical protein